MQLRIVAFLVVVGAATAGAGKLRDAHPIVRVIEQIKGLQQQAKEDGENEEVAFEKMQYWCSENIKALNKAMDKSRNQIAVLADQVEGNKQMIGALDKEISELAGNLEEMDKRKTKAKDMRKDENTAFEAENQDLQDTIDAIGEALQGLQDSKASNLQVAQEHARKVLGFIETFATPEQMAPLTAFLQQPDAANKGQRDAAVQSYSFKGGKLIDMMKDMKLQMENKQQATNDAETNAANAHKLAMQSLNAEIDAATEAKTKKEATKGNREEEMGNQKVDKTAAEECLEADTSSLKNTRTTCQTKQSEWDERSKTREEEIEAMDAAIKILSKAAGVRTEAPNNPALREAGSFLQVDDPRVKAVQLLRSKAHLQHSASLQHFADQLEKHTGDPFKQVINKVQKMIFRLMAEQKDEDDHKAWCDLELEKTKTDKEDTQETLDRLQAKIDSFTSQINSDKQAVQDANDKIAELTQQMKEETEFRATGKKENEKSLADAQAGKQAIEGAIQVLTDFYKSSGEMPKEDWEFAQVKTTAVNLPEEPSTWDSSYSGVEGNSGVMKLLEKTLEDFCTMEAEVKANEETDQNTFTAWMSSAKIDMAKQKQISETKSGEVNRMVAKLESKNKKHKKETSDMEAVQQYEADLQKACVDGDSSYEDRKDARTKEINALKEAQGILQDAFKESFLQVANLRRRAM